MNRVTPAGASPSPWVVGGGRWATTQDGPAAVSVFVCRCGFWLLGRRSCDHALMTAGLCVLYRFRLVPGKEEQFIDGWRRITIGLRERRGGLGSRLHRGDDGLWYAYAQWPSKEARQVAFNGESVDSEAQAGMADAIAERLPEIVMAPVCDLLAPFDAS